MTLKLGMKMFQDPGLEIEQQVKFRLELALGQYLKTTKNELVLFVKDPIISERFVLLFRHL